MSIRIRMFLIGIILLTSVAPFNAHAEETCRLGINTTFRTLREEIKSIEGLGVRTIRVPLEWQRAKVQPGEYDWSTIDRVLQEARTRNIEVLFTIRTLFKEAGKGWKPKRGVIELNPEPMNKKEWVHFVEALADRFRGQGVVYEIENEVNEASLWKGTVEQYVELLGNGYDVIKKADPSAKVLPSAMRCGILQNSQPGWAGEKAWKWHDGWLKPILSAKKFDMVNVHNYYFPSDITANGLTFRSYLLHIRELMKGSGLGERPIWITETGFVSLPTDASGRIDDGSYEKQARWLTEAYQQAVEFGAERVYWRFLRDSKEAYFGSMGLEDGKGNPRPSWNAFRQLAK
ncbi:MAG TPA: cellulase family glycosylhydrolase [Thermodesulfobacteriota bacterium]|nr:cellulase family glycosylhydrolase [Thermodesulfobacteriota bacterium]